uniref:Gluconate transport inducer 1 n=1 Tax=Sparassis latifolia TaxID=1202976 RepID=A0A6B9M545_9APHY|nr:gluconate transport inducer 1 [Sparassis latifolia]
MPLRPTVTAVTAGVPPFHGYVDTTEDALCLIEIYRELADRADTRTHHEAATHSEASQEDHSTEGGVMLKRYGLIKKTITVKIDGSDHHLISYYTQEDVRSGRLQRPSSRTDLRSVEIPAELLKSSSFRYPLKYESQRGSKLNHINDGDRIDNQRSAVPSSPSRRATGEPAPRFSPISPAQFSHIPAQSSNAFHQSPSRKYEPSYPSLSLALPADVRQSASPSPTDTAYSPLSVDSSPLEQRRSSPWPSASGVTPFPDPAAVYEARQNAVQTEPSSIPGRTWPNQQPARFDRTFDQGASNAGAGAHRVGVSAWPPGTATFSGQTYTSASPMSPLTSSYPGSSTRGCDQTRARVSSPAWAWMQDSASSQYCQLPQAAASTFSTERQASATDLPSPRSPQVRPLGYPYRH